MLVMCCVSGRVEFEELDEYIPCGSGPGGSYVSAVSYPVGFGSGDGKRKRAYMVDHLVRDTAVVLQDVVVHRAGGFGDLLCDGLLLKSS